MNRLAGFAILAILVLAASCSYEQWQDVRNGLAESLDQLPYLQNFEEITAVHGESRMESCYYAETVIVFGTAMSEAEALATYADALHSLGWLDRRHDERSRVLIRGAHERIRVTGYQSLSVEMNEEYQQAKDDFPTIISVSLTFYVPQREGC
jgi:hypothetical protein